MCIIGLNYRILKEGETIYNAKQTKNENDLSAKAFSSVFQDMLKLAEIEKTSQLLAEEIEKDIL